MLFAVGFTWLTSSNQADILNEEKYEWEEGMTDLFLTPSSGDLVFHSGERKELTVQIINPTAQPVRVNISIPGADDSIDDRFPITYHPSGVLLLEENSSIVVEIQITASLEFDSLTNDGFSLFVTPMNDTESTGFSQSYYSSDFDIYHKGELISIVDWLFGNQVIVGVICILVLIGLVYLRFNGTDVG